MRVGGEGIALIKAGRAFLAHQGAGQRGVGTGIAATGGPAPAPAVSPDVVIRRRGWQTLLAVRGAGALGFTGAEVGGAAPGWRR